MHDLNSLQFVTVPIVDEIFPEQPWLDIPTTSIFKVHTGSQQLDALITLINEYHSLQKDDKCQLLARQFLLEKIQILASEKAVLIDTHINKELHDMLVKLSFVAKGKRTYLKRLEIIELNSGNPLSIGHLFNYLIGNKSRHGKLRTVRRKDEAFEFDPCARIDYETRSGIFFDLFIQWKHEAELNENLPSFYMWLENKDSETQLITPTPMQYIRLLGLHGCLIDDGSISLANHKEINGFSDIYTVSPEGELYINIGREYFSGLNAIHHPNINSPDLPVLCGGHLSIANGKIMAISNFTGHYLATLENFVNTIKLLSAKQCIDENAQLSFFDGGNQTKTMFYRDFCRRYIDTVHVAQKPVLSTERIHTENRLTPRMQAMAHMLAVKTKLQVKEKTKSSSLAPAMVHPRIMPSAELLQPSITRENLGRLEAQTTRSLVNEQISKISQSVNWKYKQEPVINGDITSDRIVSEIVRSSGPPTTLIQKISNNDLEIKAVDFSNSGFADGYTIDLAIALQRNTVLEYLDLRNNGFTEESFKVLLESINKHPSLKIVEISSGALSPTIMEALAKALQDKTGTKRGGKPYGY